MTDELRAKCKPCPFCGRTDALMFAAGSGDLSHQREVLCASRGCYACGPIADSAEAAIEAWNRRALA